MSRVAIRPHSGPQTDFLRSSADLVVYGGAAGGGKSWALLAEPCRHVHRPGFHGLILRNSSTQVRNQGGLWDQSQEIYPLLGGRSREHTLEWKFPSGATIKFGYLEHEKDKYNYHGAELAYIGFDELTQFSASQFWYLLSRNRSRCGIRPYIRATCNPDPDSFVADLVSWYVDQETGYPIAERSGIVRHFHRRDGDRLEWGADPAPMAYVDPKTGRAIAPKSFTFIRANLEDNPSLDIGDPSYRSNLMAMGLVDRERLLMGNWIIRHQAGTVFRREWFKIVNRVPSDLVRVVRYWDKAGSDETSKDGDSSAGVAIGRTSSGRIVVTDVVTGKWTYYDRNTIIKQTAELDVTTYRGADLALWIEREPGHNATESTDTLAKLLIEYAPRFDRVVKSKLARAKEFSAAAESGIVDVVASHWTARWIEELVNFPDAPHDDQVDGSTGAFMKLVTVKDRTERVGPSAGKPIRR